MIIINGVIIYIRRAILATVVEEHAPEAQRLRRLDVLISELMVSFSLIQQNVYINKAK